MEVYITNSGIVLLLFTFLFGPSLSLDCITCEWSAGSDTDAGCVATPYKENSTTCPEPEGNQNYICQTKIIYRSAMNNHYLASLSRKCELEHGKCDNHCNPESGQNCYSCCNANNNCNSLPLSSAFLPAHLAYNITSTAAPEVFRTGSCVMNYLILVGVGMVLV